ncbi:S8 family serine peptidase [Stieleria varia]|uniref:Calcium-dependent protease n=1 Tax=Stieleria varia TaxID=2528005 RepID=A0A5C6B1D1_9BACT|nr:S8 family serine peptidase [Stieleria varia]TWU04234.1 Calcium-dependent protease precursor [Stieleria varia]
MPQSRHLRTVLRGERLESRRLLAVAGSDVMSRELGQAPFLDKGIRYYDLDTPVLLSVMPNRMAVRWNESPTSLPSSVRPLRIVDGDVRIFELPEPVSVGPNLQDYVRSFPGYDSEVPVFHNPETNSEVVVFDEVIVALKEVVDASDFFGQHELVQSYKPLSGTSDQFVVTVAIGAGIDAIIASNTLRNDVAVSWAAPNFYQSWQRTAIPNDPRFVNQWHAENNGQGGGVIDADVDLPTAWDVNSGGSPDIVIGIIDDGVATDHPDILNHANPGEIPGDGIDNDGNGWIDDVHGWNFVADNNQSSYTPVDDHGTAVAGVAAGRGDNGIGIAGAAYRSPVLSARIFDNGATASDANIAAAIYYMAGRTRDGNGTWRSADIVNNSWSGGSPSTVIRQALQWGTTQGRLGQGAMYLFATGNEFGSVDLPASLSSLIPGVVSVGATNNFGERSNYSNSGPQVDLVAPSNDTRPGYLAIDTTDVPGSQGYTSSDYTGTGGTGFGGTSAATPLATGIAALAMAELAEQNIVLSPAQMRQWMRANTDLIGGSYATDSGHNNDFGYGRVNAGSLLQSIGKPEISIVTDRDELVDSGSPTFIGDAGVALATSKTFRVRNQGTSPLELTSLEIASGPFTIQNVFSPSTLDVGESATFTIRYTASQLGVESGLVVVGSSDADEALFEIPVTGNGLTPAITGIAFEDFNGDGLRGIDEPVIDDREVFLDWNEDGSLTPVDATFTSTGTAPIQDLQTASLPIVVSGVPSATSIEVTVDLTHTYTGDLHISLINPDGDRVVLANHVGEDGDHFTGTIFADDATTPISAGAPPFVGRFLPNEALSGAIKSDLNGTWTLEVRDDADIDVGTLHQWSIRFLGSEPVTKTNSAGVYGFLDLTPGTYHVTSLAPAQWQATSPESSAVTLLIPGDSGVVDFGTAVRDRVYGRVFDDANGDGVQDAGDVGLPVETVFLDINGNGLPDDGIVDPLAAVEPAALTDSFGNYQLDLSAGLNDVRLVVPNGRSHTLPIAGLHQVSTDGTALFDRDFGTAIAISEAHIVDRGLFYAGATGVNLSSEGDAEAARDPGKIALLPEESSGLQHYTNYIHGLNGLLFDIETMPDGTTDSDLEGVLQFAVWDGIDPSGFQPIDSAIAFAVELVTMTPLATRVKVTFPNNAIENTWLRTTIPAGPVTGLSTDDVFYFGNVIGDIGIGNTATRLRVNALDTVSVRANQSLSLNSAAVDNPHDLNRDGRVNALDTVYVRANQDLSGSVAPITAPAKQSPPTKTNETHANDSSIESNGPIDAYFAELDPQQIQE